jgi:DNA invertase Pin-like site-specific DNA recombinase
VARVSNRLDRDGLISLKGGLDLLTPAGRLMANMLAGVAVYEAEVRAERILAGQSAARDRGVHWGGWARGRRIKLTGSRSRRSSG